jgi:hypothetical protein
MASQGCSFREESARRKIHSGARSSVTGPPPAPVPRGGRRERNVAGRDTQHPNPDADRSRRDPGWRSGVRAREIPQPKGSGQLPSGNSSETGTDRADDEARPALWQDLARFAGKIHSAVRRAAVAARFFSHGRAINIRGIRGAPQPGFELDPGERMENLLPPDGLRPDARAPDGRAACGCHSSRRFPSPRLDSGAVPDPRPSHPPLAITLDPPISPHPSF